MVSRLALFLSLVFATIPAFPKEVRWLIAHEPIGAFRRAAQVFGQELEKETKGAMTLKVLTPKDFGGKESVYHSEMFDLIRSGKVELGQVVTTGLGELEPKFWVFDLPFLFKDIAHTERVLEGPIGQKMLASLEKKNLRGLAFTFSGGFRVIPTLNKPVRDVSDLKGMKVRTTNSPVTNETLKLVGATPMPLTIEDSRAAFETSGIDAAETTYVRIDAMTGKKTKYVTESFHNLYLTSIIASDKFFKSLTEGERQALKKAATVAARVERDFSIKDGEVTKQELAKRGVQLVQLSAEAKQKFADQVKPLYSKFESMFGRDLIDGIVAAQ